ncbi:hypothetical protein MMC13_002499 [Lambiella insularis]|nr:hypothetical protein [Lambiella insularis]
MKDCESHGVVLGVAENCNVETSDATTVVLAVKVERAGVAGIDEIGVLVKRVDVEGTGSGENVGLLAVVVETKGDDCLDEVKDAEVVEDHVGLIVTTMVSVGGDIFTTEMDAVG